MRRERSKEVLLRCFSWAELLLDRCPAKVVQPEVRDRLLGAALKALLRQEDEVASTALRFAANLTAMGEQLGEEGEDLVGSMCHRLFRLMKEQPNLLARRGELIVRKICDGLVHQGVDVQRFFATAAKAINQEEDKAFARRLVQVLNRGLLTGPETKAFRAWLQLEVRRCEQKGELRPELQMVLMEAWMVCPVSSLALSFWLNEFEFAAGLATRLATAPRTDEIEAQLKDFVELLESPIPVLAADHSPSMKLKCLPRNQPWASKDEENNLCIMSWNVLAPTLAETWPGQREFREERLAALLEVLDLYASCDILCLQELEVGISLELVQSFLEEKGFDVAVQDREGHPVINATFFRRSLLRLSWVASRSRILIVGLLLPSGLSDECPLGFEATRSKGRTTDKVSAKDEHGEIEPLHKAKDRTMKSKVVCGDFNSNLALDTHLSDLLAEHSLFRTPTKGFTHSLGAALDHLCSTEHLAPRRVLQAASRQDLQGLPNKERLRGRWWLAQGSRKLRASKGMPECPSDHLPVAATFELLFPQWQCPALPVAQLPPQLLMEWSELLASGLRSNSSKKARKEQKQLEDIWIQKVANLLGINLCFSSDPVFPVFSDLRLQMLGALQHRSALLRAMLQLGALLPKEKCIQGRLQVLETGVLLDRVTAKAKGTGPFRDKCCKQAQDLLERFDEVCEKDHRWKDCIL
eukprot:s2400_g9.t1